MITNIVAIRQTLIKQYFSYQKSILFLLLIASIYGFMLGAKYSAMGASVEFAQFLLGKVMYPFDSKEYYLFASTFSLLNYLSAFFLLLTDSEVLAAIFTSGIIGSIAFQVLALGIFIFCRNTFFTLISAVFIASINLFGEGIAYPIYFMGSNHDFGRIALFFPLYAILLISFSRTRLGFFLLGLSIGVHPTMGLWASICFISAAISYKVSINDWRINKNATFNFLFGISIVIVIYLFQRWYFQVTFSENLNNFEASEIFNNYIKLWDHHRQKFYPSINGGICYALSSLGISYFLLIKKYKFISNNINIYLRFIFITSLFSIPFIFIPSWFAPELFPSFFIAIMPSRFINYSIFLFTPLIVGIFWTIAERKKYLYILCISFWIGLFLIYTKGLMSQQVIWSFFALLLLLFFLVFEKKLKNKVFVWGQALIMIFIIIWLTFSPFYIYHIITNVRVQNFSALNIPLLTNKLVLVTMERYLLQAENRRPTITPHLDGFAYLPNGIALVKLNKASEDIYGISLKNKQPQVKNFHASTFSLGDYKNLWINRSCQEWETLAEKYGFDLIIVPDTVELKVNLIFNDKLFNGYNPSCIKK